MKYTIISVSNRREHYKKAIREELSAHKEVTDIEFCGPEDDKIGRMKEYGLHFNDEHWHPQTGELGIWLSSFACWKWCVDNDEPLRYFEDDALIKPGFDGWYDTLFEPDLTTDPLKPELISLIVPYNQHQDFGWQYYQRQAMINYPDGAPANLVGYKRMARAYQGYCNAAMEIYPDGARKLIDAAHQHGIYTPVDCFVFEQGFDATRDARTLNRIDILTPKPQYATGVDVDWNAETHIHGTGLA